MLSPCLIIIWSITPIPAMRSCISPRFLPGFLPGWHTGHGIPTEIRAIYLYPAGCTSQAGDSGWFSLLDPESGIFPYSRKKSGCSGASPEKGSRIFPVLEFYGSLPGLLLRHGFPQLRIQPEGSAHLFTTKIPVRYKRKNFSSFFFSAACLQSLHSAPAPAGVPRESSI